MSSAELQASHMGLLLRAASAVGSSKLSGLATGSWRVYLRKSIRLSDLTL